MKTSSITKLIYSVLLEPGCSRKNVSLNESPSSHINYYILRRTGRGGGVAAIIHSSLLINPRLKHSYNLCESFTVSRKPEPKLEKTVLFVSFDG